MPSGVSSIEDKRHTIHLRVEIVDDAEQLDANNLYDSSRLGTSAKRKDEAEKIRYQRKHGCMADAGGYEE